MSIDVAYQFGGLRDLDANLKTLIREMKKTQRRGVTKAGRVLRKSVKALVPKESGLMRRRLIMQVRTYQQSGSVQAIVGVAKGPAEMVKVKRVFRIIGRGKMKRGGKGGRTVFLPKAKPQFRMVKRNPQYLLHLIELGFTQASGRHVPGKAPIRRGHAAAKAEMEQVLAAEFATGIEGAPLK